MNIAWSKHRTLHRWSGLSTRSNRECGHHLWLFAFCWDLRFEHSIAEARNTLHWDGTIPLPLAPVGRIVTHIYEKSNIYPRLPHREKREHVSPGGESWLLPCSDKLSLRPMSDSLSRWAKFLHVFFEDCKATRKAQELWLEDYHEPCTHHSESGQQGGGATFRVFLSLSSFLFAKVVARLMTCVPGAAPGLCCKDWVCWLPTEALHPRHGSLSLCVEAIQGEISRDSWAGNNQVPTFWYCLGRVRSARWDSQAVLPRANSGKTPIFATAEMTCILASIRGCRLWRVFKVFCGTTHNIIVLHNVPSSIMFKSEVQACSRLFQWQVGLARACAWQRRILRLAFGLPWKHHRYGWYEIYLRFLAATSCNS